MARKPVFNLEAQARPGDKIIDGWPVSCSRTQQLEGKDIQRATDKEYSECRKITMRPGYETLTKIRYTK